MSSEAATTLLVLNATVALMETIASANAALARMRALAERGEITAAELQALMQRTNTAVAAYSAAIASHE